MKSVVVASAAAAALLAAIAYHFATSNADSAKVATSNLLEAMVGADGPCVITDGGAL